jgi:hypothetical protein
MQKVGSFRRDGCSKTGDVWPVPMDRFQPGSWFVIDWMADQWDKWATQQITYELDNG